MDLSFSIGAANMTNPPYNCTISTGATTNTTITLVLLTQRTSGKCDYWCCLFQFP
jgi:hypothetical protein